MISVSTVIALLAMHLVADFLLQTDWMATNKSSHWEPLFIHVFVYSLPFIVFGSVTFVIFTFMMHLITDAISSRATSYLWKKEERHWFFVVIGADQFAHAVALIYGYVWFAGL